jgi:hypothetical protein
LVWVLGHFVEVEVVLDLLDGAVVVAEQAALAVGAVELADEGVAGLGLVLDVEGLRLVDELVVPVSKLAFVAISAHPHFDPVFAQFSFELSPIRFISFQHRFAC